MKNFRICATIAAASVISACSSGSSSIGDEIAAEVPEVEVPEAEVPEVIEELATFDELIERGTDIVGDFDDFTDPTTLPQSGSAQYDGVIVASADGDEDIAGVLVLDVNFGDDENFLSGSATDFVSESGDEFSGTLTVENSTIDRNVDVQVEFTFDADLVGELADDDEIFNVDGFIRGDFIDGDSDALLGVVSGIVTENSTGEVAELDGAFAAER